MTATDLGPAPTLLNEWTTPTFFWLFILAASVAGVVYLTVTWHRLAREFDAAEDNIRNEPHFNYHCATQGHRYQADGYEWLCVVCGERRPRTAIRWVDEESAS